MSKSALPVILLLCACGDAATQAAAEREEHPLASAASDVLAHLPRGEAQRKALCARPGDDLLRDRFCAEEPSSPHSLVEAQKALYIDAPRLSGINGLAIAGHSTSLGARSISSINPRVIAVRVEHPLFDDKLNGAAPGSQGRVDPSLEPVAIAFARGEQRLELMVRDRVDHELRFYLLEFRQACNDAEAGCGPADLLSPAIEQDWLEISLYDERDLTNTVLDCAPCHQTNGPGTTKFLRMQELRSPWTHWFAQETAGGRALIEDYRAARGEEPLFGLGGADLLQRANPVSLELQAVYGGPNSQPNPFDSEKIEAEVSASTAAHGGGQPRDNSVPGKSETWRAGHEVARRGEAITFPYHDVKVTDPDKLVRMTEAYRAFREGELAPAALPDIREVLPDDPRLLAEMGFTTQPGASGEQVLLEACAMCHNARLDQSLSRARFRADLQGMSREERDRAIERLQLPESDVRHMPPARLRFLSSEARARAIEVLSRGGAQ